NQKRAVGGAIVKISDSWVAEADHSWSEARFSSSTPGGLTGAGTTAVRAGVINAFTDLKAFPANFAPFIDQAVINTPARTRMNDSTLRFAGPVGSLPAGAPTLSILLEHRQEKYSDSFGLSGFERRLFPSTSQSIDSLYMEANVPLISERNAMPGVG